MTMALVFCGADKPATSNLSTSNPTTSKPADPATPDKPWRSS